MHRAGPATEDQQDILSWEHANNGYLTVREAFLHYREKGTNVAWLTKIWQRFTPTKISIFLWKCYHDRLPVEYNANNRGIIVEGGCIGIDGAILEEKEHVLRSCNFARGVWGWVSYVLCLDLSFI